MEKTLTPRELAIQRGCSIDYIYRELAVNKYPGATKIGRRWTIPAEAVRTREEARGNASR